MKREEIIKLAQDYGMAVSVSGNGYWDNPQQLVAFAAAIEARTREKALKEVYEECKLLKIWGKEPHREKLMDSGNDFESFRNNWALLKNAAT